MLILSSKTISVPPACPLVAVLMSSEMVTEGTAGVSGKLIHKSSFYDCVLHVDDFDYISNNYTFIRDITL